MPIREFEETVTCPYNPAHQANTKIRGGRLPAPLKSLFPLFQILPSRLQVHLVRCARQHPTAEMVICPFNATHHIPKQEVDSHIKKCEYRKTIEEAKYMKLVS